MHRGFPWFKFGRQKTTEQRINEAPADFRRWMGEEEGAPVASTQEQTPEPAPTESVPKVPKASESQAPRVASGQPQPKDFGVTPEQVTAYKPSAPWSPVSFGVIFFLVWLAFPFAVVLSNGSVWRFLGILGVSACVFYCISYVWHAGYLSREVRSHIEAFLHAKAEYDNALQQVEQERKRRQAEQEEARRQAELEERRRHGDHWLALSGPDLEVGVAELYRRHGYVVETTPVTGDQGVDLFLRKDGQLTVVQCKGQKRPVGQPYVRDLHGAMHHFHARRAIFVATGGFTKQAILYAQHERIQLVDLNGILSLQEAVAKK